MRPFLIITLLLFSCSSCGQDTLLVDTSFITVASPIHDTLVIEPVSPAEKVISVKKKKPKKKVKEKKIKEEAVAIKTINTANDDKSEKGSRLLFMWVLIIAAVIIFILLRLNSIKEDKPGTTNSREDDLIADTLYRLFLPRREYYRNIYLKSEAWKRKRFLVLRRDNWRCVYCGGRATEVHHTRYAKRNIGKEPIEWLVSICRSCHDCRH